MKVKLDVDVKVGNNPKVIVIDEAKAMGAYHVVLDKSVTHHLPIKNLKRVGCKSKQFCMPPIIEFLAFDRFGVF